MTGRHEIHCHYCLCHFRSFYSCAEFSSLQCTFFLEEMGIILSQSGGRTLNYTYLRELQIKLALLTGLMVDRACVCMCACVCMPVCMCCVYTFCVCVCTRACVCMCMRAFARLCACVVRVCSVCVYLRVCRCAMCFTRVVREECFKYLQF